MNVVLFFCGSQKSCTYVFIGFDILNDGIEDFRKQVNIWNCKLQNPIDTDFSNPMTARMLNDQMLQLEKIFMTSHHKSGAEIQNVGNSNLVLLQGGLKNGKASFPRSQSFTFLMADLHQDINQVVGTYLHLEGTLMEHFLEGIAPLRHINPNEKGSKYKSYLLS